MTHADVPSESYLGDCPFVVAAFAATAFRGAFIPGRCPGLRLFAAPARVGFIVVESLGRSIRNSALVLDHDTTAASGQTTREGTSNTCSPGQGPGSRG